MKDNSNLEFRKIPSLQYLYEVNSNGTIIRNVKSKRHLKCFKKSHNGGTEYWCTQVNIKKHIRKVFLHRAVAECWYGPRPDGMQVDHIDRNSLNNDYRNLRYASKSEQMKNRDYGKFQDAWMSNLGISHVVPVALTDTEGNRMVFATSRQAANYLATVYPDKKSKSFSDKFYLRRKHIFDFDVNYLNAETAYGNQEMGKEQSTKYLVGTMDKWNDAKKAEERDRVKHL